MMLVAITTVNPMALNMYVPSMPSVERTFGSSPELVQLTLTLPLVAISLIQLAIGPLSDQHGRRPVLLVGMILFCLGTIGCIIAPNIEFLIISRMVQVSGGAAGIVLSRAMVRDCFDSRQSASILGYVTMGMAIAPMVSPAIGGLIDEYIGWRHSFQFALAVGLIVTFIAWYDLAETNTNVGKTAGFSSLMNNFLVLSKIRDFWIYTIVSACVSACFFIFLGGAPYVSSQILEIGSAEYGFYFIFVAGGYAFGNFLSGRYSMRFGQYQMILMGNVATLAGILFICLGFGLGYIHPLSLFLPMMLTGIGNGLVLPSTMAGTVSVRPDLAGTAAGLSGSIIMGMGALGSFVVRPIMDGTIWPMLYLMLAVIISGLIVSIKIRLPDAQPNQV